MDGCLGLAPGAGFLGGVPGIGVRGRCSWAVFQAAVSIVIERGKIKMAMYMIRTVAGTRYHVHGKSYLYQDFHSNQLVFIKGLKIPKVSDNR